MSDLDYDSLIEQTYEALEQALDEVEEDIDYETSGGVLTVTFSNGSSLIFSRQPPTRQLWLAARSGGYHYEYDSAAGDWRNTRDGSLLRPTVVREMSNQGGVAFSWD